jgi:hypothetical protein
MNDLQAAMVGFDITPRIHPKFGAYGTTPSMYVIDMPLQGRCLALTQGDRKLLWFAVDQFPLTVPGSAMLRTRLAEELALDGDQIVWTASQTHAAGAVPGSDLVGNLTCDLSQQDPTFAAAEGDRLFKAYVLAGRQALGQVQPVNVFAGHACCDSMSYNGRLPMPTGGVKFTRDHGEGLQSGKYFDTRVNLVRFEDRQGQTLGVVFNLGCRAATLLNDKYISPDWPGTARQTIEATLDGRPAMFVQGFCADVNCNYFFGTPEQAKITGRRVGQSVIEALPTLIPVRNSPLAWDQRTIAIQCRPRYDQQEIDAQRSARLAYIDELQYDPQATWVCGINYPERMPVDVRRTLVKTQLDYLDEAQRQLDEDDPPPSQLELPLTVVRFGDVAALMSPGDNFSITARNVRQRSPFVHTLTCGNTNGIFGYLSPDDDIDRGGYEPDSSWKALMGAGFRLAPAKGTADRVVSASIELLQNLR